MPGTLRAWEHDNTRPGTNIFHLTNNNIARSNTGTAVCRVDNPAPVNCNREQETFAFSGLFRENRKNPGAAGRLRAHRRWLGDLPDFLVRSPRSAGAGRRVGSRYLRGCGHRTSVGEHLWNEFSGHRAGGQCHSGGGVAGAAVDTLQDALKNVPGITLNAGEGGTHGDNINLRGFAASDDFFLDGLRDTGFYTRDSFDLEGIEVYKGPASTLFGRGSTGGVVNQVSKIPQLTDFARASVVGGTNSEIRGTSDLNYAITDDAAFRLNAMGLRSQVADRDFVKNERWGLAPSFAFGLGEPTQLIVDYLHQQQNDIPDYGIPFAFGKPVPVPRDTYYGLPEDDRTQAKVDVGTLLFKASSMIRSG